MFEFCLFAAGAWVAVLAPLGGLVLLIQAGEGARGVLEELAAERPMGELVGKVVGNVVLGNVVLGNVVLGKGRLVESCLIEAFSSLLSNCFLILFR